MSIRRLMIVTMVLLVITPSLRVQAHSQLEPETARYFPETHNWLSAPFLSYWNKNGAVSMFGYPLEAVDTAIHADNHEFAYQVFERNRLEYHPDNPAPYKVQLGRLGEEVLLQQGRNWRDFPRGEPIRGCDFFPQTQHSLCGDFQAYWRSHGLALDEQPTISHDESLALFGFPLSEPTLETNADGHVVLTQWFERARFEYHPDNPAEHRVLLGLLGKERYGNGATGVIKDLSGSVGMVFLDGDGMLDETNSGPFWDTAKRWGLNITHAEIILVGPNYSNPTLSDFGGWYNATVPIESDHRYHFAETMPSPPPVGEFRMYYFIAGTCSNGKPIWANPYGFQEVELTAASVHTADFPHINLRCEE